ncbi:MAG: alpha-amylase family glycosyl hydrolase [Bacteroidota bacterium]|nr:alpha-amylase family glycosyl hydrolase [Bacteroidota bacterium]
MQSFCDSDKDGKGDIKGMTSKLDYLKDLGVESVWLMPINPSPSYHKYDVTDYYSIHPDYGTIDDFKQFVQEAHRRNIKVIMDLVLNHSSRQHPWFKDAVSNEKSPYRDYYVWAHKDDPKLQVPAKKISGDSDNRYHWNKVAGSDYLYYSYFGSSMPDLNYDNPKLRAEVIKIGKYWLKDIGVDGFRLDAARHIFPDERAKENHSWWVYFRNEMQKVNRDVYLIGEVWAPAEVVGPYMKGLPALFNFDMGYAITKAVNEEQAENLVANHKKIRDFYKTINPEYMDATFLTNHDQNRIMSAVNGDAHKAKMAAALLLTLPGSPYIYYGEELGMIGKKPDEYIREPFIWDTKEKDNCRTTWIKPRYSTDSTVVPEIQQMADNNSILQHYISLIHLRNSNKVLTHGEIAPAEVGVKSVCAFLRTYENESLLVLHNLSKTEVQFYLPEALKAYNKVLFSTNNAIKQNELVAVPPYSTLVLEKR